MYICGREVGRHHMGRASTQVEINRDGELGLFHHTGCALFITRSGAHPLLANMRDHLLVPGARLEQAVATLSELCGEVRVLD